MTRTTDGPPDHLAAAKAKEALEEAERGHDPCPQGSADVAPASPASVEAAAQEAGDGPEGVGLSR